MVVTQQDLIIRQLAATSDNTLEFIIRNLIDEHDTREMERGEKYYHNENEILQRRIYLYDEQGRKRVDETAVNNRVPHNWHKLLVDQKVSYLLGRPAVIDSDDEKYTEEINKHLDEDWDDNLQETGKESSNKGAAYLHPYIDEAGEFTYARIPSEQCIPIYDTDYEEKIVKFIRYYEFVVNGRSTIRAEWWDEETVTYFIQAGSGLFEQEIPKEGEENPDSHFYYRGEGYGWGRVPFVEFRNNEERYPDLKYYRELIDVYDLIVSDMANDITDIQKLIYVLRGYDGTSLEEFVTNLRRFRAVKLSEEGGLDTLSAEIPVEAITKFMDRAEENIFLFGQGVNVKTDRFGNSPSGIALKFLYGLLDLKAGIMARKFSRAMKDFLWFLHEYLDIARLMRVTDDMRDSVRVTFSKSMIMNDLELVSMAQASKGIISDATILANHPWVEDARAEQERLEEDNAGRVDLDAPVDDDEDVADEPDE